MQGDKSYATGRRKTAIARVWVKPGTGKIVINHQPMSEYFRRQTLGLIVRQPLELLDVKDSFDISALVDGGGWSGQAGAIQLALARCLVQFNEGDRKSLRKEGYLTRDSRCVERKKYGKKKARKSFQFSKR